MQNWKIWTLCVFAATAFAACSEDDPTPTPTPDAGSDASDTGDVSPDVDPDTSVDADSTPEPDADAGPDPDSDTGPDVDATPDPDADVSPDIDTTPEPTTCLDRCAAALAACPDAIGAGTPCETTVAADWQDLCEMACEEIPAIVEIAYAGETCVPGVRNILDRGGLADLCLASGCPPLETDYAPGADDGWPACVSDGGTYVQINENVSSIARIAAFDEIATLLWNRDTAPSADDFLDAFEAYLTGEGLESRVSRREDEHYPPVVDGAGNVLRCRDEGVPALDPDRCVGPAQIIPLLNDAFEKGALGEIPLVNAARAEAGLLWFLYVSVHKEALTCTTAIADCDSAWAYYSGGGQPDEPRGLARYVVDVSPWAHDRIWDGLLAVRCWRDLDREATATTIARRDLALNQMDRALLYAMARIVTERALAMVTTPQTRDASFAFLQILGPVLNRAITEADASEATTWTAALDGASLDDIDATDLVTVTDRVFACP